MALVVEDGTAKTNSNAYGETTDAQTYYTDMGYTDTPSEATMIRGSRTLDAMFREALKGVKATSGQAMVWPRNRVTDEDGNNIASDTIPNGVKYAAFELARIVPVNQSLTPNQWIKRVKAGSAEVEFASGQNSRQVLDFVDELMAPFLRRRGVLVRA